jgi:Flp pilus assembly pilin Flp
VEEWPKGEAMTVLLRFLRDERGATTIEYCVIAGIVTVGLILNFVAIGTKVANKFVPVGYGLN